MKSESENPEPLRKLGRLIKLKKRPGNLKRATSRLIHRSTWARRPARHVMRMWPKAMTRGRIGRPLLLSIRDQSGRDVKHVMALGRSTQSQAIPAR